MAVEFKLPDLGEEVESGEVISVLVSVGDRITMEQSVLEMETDKAAFEVPSDVEGTVKEIHVKEGDEVKPGQTVLTLEEEDDGREEKKENADTRRENLDEEAQTEDEKEDVEVEEKDKDKEEPEERKRKGERKESGREKSRGKKKRSEKDTQEKKKTGDDDEASEKKEETQESVHEEKPPAPAAPSVRRLARELGIGIDAVEGSGPEGRISEEDVKDHARRMLEKSPGKAAPSGALPDFGKWGNVERKAMSRVRRQTTRSTSRSWSEIPHVTHFDEADVTETDRLRQQYGKSVEEAGGKLTWTAVVVKIAAAALTHFPQFRASLDMANEEIVIKNYFHIGIAVDTDRGLLVPVIRDTDRKTMVDIAVELVRLSEKARERNIKPEDLEGGVFTVTNLGGIGGTQFSPIVYAPQVAILGMSRLRTVPVLRDDRLETRMMLPLSLSYDHRIIDGADAARFLRWIAEALERPFFLLLKG